jgi:acyl-CoA synthetase (AMP-forming)/AMP-acid ligase II
MQFDYEGPLLPDMVRLHGKWYPDRLAVVDDEKALTWSVLDKNCNQVANGLHKLGIGKGDSVVIIMDSCVEYIEVMYGIWKAGAVVVPLNLAVNEDGMEMMLKDCGARAMFLTPAQHDRLSDRLDGIETFSNDAVFVHGVTTPAQSRLYESWREEQNSADPEISIDQSDPCNIIYSSGTTGTPKGIKHVHGRRIRSIYELALAHRYRFGAISICPIGLYSNIAWGSILCPLIVGGTCVIRKVFKPAAWIETVEEFQVTHSMMVPLQIQMILEADNFTTKAVASLEAIVSGGSPLFAGLKQKAIEQLDCSVIELYGLTEGFMTTLQPEEAEGRLSSVGKPVCGNDYIILDDDDNLLNWGDSGEICVRSVHWMVEYHNRPSATDEAMFVDEHGTQWLRTGDIGRTDQDGYLYIVDRKKDMILSGSQNIYPTDIEAVMVDHPLVSEVTVIGIPHEKWGETPLALVVLRGPGDEETANDIHTWTNERVGKRQRISAVEIREDLPRNPNGKILKREIRKEYWD